MIMYSIYSFITSLGFAIIYNVKGKNVFLAGIGGGVSWLVYLIAHHLYNSNVLALFLGAVAVSIYSEVMARLFKAPVTTFIICGIIPLVPGNGMYYTMYEIILGNVAKATTYGIQTLGSAGSIAIAIAMVSSTSKLLLMKKRIFSLNQNNH
ncbi:threonine/serine exporter family protein [Clostridium arbusti]|uniref:threonine/serine exporter family protein n=1 Tax=Clostridium arbusti TaxID=1137848 RepID=UPI000288A7A6|nr:threonine/serine exporter family protein [Clostridium arbusti]